MPIYRAQIDFKGNKGRHFLYFEEASKQELNSTILNDSRIVNSYALNSVNFPEIVHVLAVINVIEMFRIP